LNLERVDIFQAETIRGATKIATELQYRIEVRLLGRWRQIADRHVLDHAAAKRADLSHRKTSCLKGEKNPRSSQTGGNYCDRPLTAAPAASFNLAFEETQKIADAAKQAASVSGIRTLVNLTDVTKAPLGAPIFQPHRGNAAPLAFSRPHFELCKA
jgi:hypothetical protein